MERRWCSFLIVSGFFVVIACSVAGVKLYRLFYQPMLTENNQSNIVQIDHAMSASAFTHRLKSRQLIASDRLFLLLIRAQGFADKLKAGVYQIKQHESAEQFLYRVVTGDVLVESFKIIEGTTQRQISANLTKAKFLTYNDSDWQAIDVNQPSAEGLLLADTYNYDAGSEAKVLIQHAHAKLQDYLNDSWQHRDLGLPYKTPYELLVVASILEKETASAEEKRIISGVIVNRLRKGMPLQMDPTVIYALGLAYQDKLAKQDLHVTSPYNTYKNRGLPPTPIAMVGKEAITAAAHPQTHDYLYFVASGNGCHVFSSTYDQQRQAIARYLIHAH